MNVLAPHTQWGDKLFFADSLHAWNGQELTTSISMFPLSLLYSLLVLKYIHNKGTFPWWCAEIVIKNGEFFCKCYIQRGDTRIWESFEGNRYIPSSTEEELSIKFNGMCSSNDTNFSRFTFSFLFLVERYWGCVVCEDTLTNQPVLCLEDHPFHRECFEPYLSCSFSSFFSVSNIFLT